MSLVQRQDRTRAVGGAAVAGAARLRDAGRHVQELLRVQPGRLSSSGTSLLGRRLGFQFVAPYYVNGVEIVFPLGARAWRRYTDLRARQWAGPEGLHVRTDLALDAPWHTVLSREEAGEDDPEPVNQLVDERAVAYFDSPGPSILAHVDASWIHCVQNFRGWVEGRPASGGVIRQLTPFLQWHSVVSVVKADAASHERASFRPTGLTRAGPGWAPTAAPQL